MARTVNDQAMVRAMAQVWGAARIAAAPPDPDRGTNSDVLSRLIDWYMRAPKFNRPPTTEDNMAQRSWTIEIRADFADQGKNKPIDTMVKKKAFELFTMLGLLEDNGQKPDIACWSEDFYHGRVELKLFAKDNVDTEAEKAALEALGAEEETPVSDELMAAAAEILHDKNNNK